MARAPNWKAKQCQTEADTRCLLWRHRMSEGESMSDIARSEGISRQAVHSALLKNERSLAKRKEQAQ
jgi:predicted DNA-binding protein YlxM (UPF0122 family)